MRHVYEHPKNLAAISPLLSALWRLSQREAAHGSSIPRAAKSRHRASGNANAYPSGNPNANGISYDDYSYDSYYDDNAATSIDSNHCNGGGRNAQQGQGGEVDGNRGFADDDGMMDAGMSAGMDMGVEGAGAGGLEPAQGTPRHAVGLSELFRSPAAVARKGPAQDEASGLKVQLFITQSYCNIYSRVGVGVGRGIGTGAGIGTFGTGTYVTVLGAGVMIGIWSCTDIGIGTGIDIGTGIGVATCIGLGTDIDIGTDIGIGNWYF